MKRFTLFAVFFLFNISLIFSQVAINPNGSPPHPSAGLDVNFTNKGMLLPRMNYEQRNAIESPAEGLIIYCTDCNTDGSGALAVFQGGSWRVFNMDCVEPGKPSAGNRVPATNSIEWNWGSVPIALGYKFGTTNDYNTAVDLGEQTSFTESGLNCWTTYTRYVWAYNECGPSLELLLTESTLEIPFSPPPTGLFHFADEYSIIWDWTDVPGATGYKWNTVNDPATALDLGENSIYFEQGLDCLTPYTRYVWAYDDCGHTSSVTLNQTTLAEPPLSPSAGTHVPSLNQIVWNWSTVSGATGYKWNTVNDYGTAQEMNMSTTKTETGLNCNTSYTRYVWAYGDCGVSPSTTLTQSTSQSPPASPVAATHVPSPTQIVWNWNTVSGATGYRWNTTNNYGTAQDMGTATSKTEAGLTCNTSYTRYVWAYGPCGVSVVTSLAQVTSMNPPATPTAGTHVPTATQVTWNWNTVAGATGYKWNITNDYGTAQDMGTATTKVETGLSCNTAYTRYVWAYSNCGVSTPRTLTQQTSLNPPAPPTAGTHVAFAGEITWNWNAVSGATGYKWNTINDYATAQDMGTLRTKTETGLSCNTAYARYVWAYSNCGNSTATTLNQTTQLDPPAPPTEGVHVPAITQMQWNWVATPGAAGYKFNTTNNISTATDLGNVLTNTETGLTCNTVYTRYIWSYSSCGESTALAISESTLEDPPAAPVAGSHIPGPNQMVWIWNTVPTATGYKWSATNDPATAEDMGTSTLKSESGLNCNTGYTRYVWSYNACGTSVATTLTATTALDPPSAPPQSTHVATGTQITWNWGEVTDATGYKWNTTNDPNGAEDLGTNLSKVETGLSCNTAFTRYVWAYNSCGTSAATSLGFSTTTGGPAAPVAGTHVPGPTQVVWNWTAVPGASGYKWSITNDYSTATDKGTATTHTETGLSCNTSYTRYIWAYNACDHSVAVAIAEITEMDPPASPVGGSHTAGLNQITWSWNPVTGATGYKWSTTNDFDLATDKGTATSHLETGLACNTSYSRYVWAYSNCGTSVETVLAQATIAQPPDLPVAGTHVTLPSQITWNWSASPNATGYKWNTADNYGTAQDMGTSTSKVETGLTCNTGYTRYVWAYGPCGFTASVSLTASTPNEAPAQPVAAASTPSANQIVWNWDAVPGAIGYKWNSTNDYGTAQDMGTAITKTQTGLTCNTAYNSYVWSYNGCGNSAATTLSGSTLNAPPATPTEGTHAPDLTAIVWNWNPVTGAVGYKWNTTNNYSTAEELGSTTTRTETGLVCGTSYTRYAWAYNSCGESVPLAMTESTTICFACGNTINVTHEVGTVAPVNKTTSYNTVTNVPGEPTKCFITSNLGASHEATSYNDATEASAGWYWQFNRPQGYKHDGTNRTPNSAWTSYIAELSDWTSATDPCSIELGDGWRIPVKSEWDNLDGQGGWATWTGPWNSPLKMHAAGRLASSNGTLSNRGSEGNYWSATQSFYELGWRLIFYSSACTMGTANKSFGYSVRCIRN